jgi:hypothetical protein
MMIALRLTEVVKAEQHRRWSKPRADTRTFNGRPIQGVCFTDNGVSFDIGISSFWKDFLK